MAAFSALPSKWIYEGDLKKFEGHQRPGMSIGALKVLIALNIEMDYDTHITDGVSLSKLEDMTGLSRPMLVPAIRKLEDIGLIKVDRSGWISTYEFLNFQPWAKIPKKNIRPYLSGLGNRSLSSLASLKIFLCLLAARDAKKDSPVYISHESLRDKTGLQARDIRPGIDLLIEYRLVFVYRRVEKGGVSKEPNQYTILNL